jgi:mannose-6-phosphate isomerase
MLSFIGKNVNDIRTWLSEHRLTEALAAQIGLPLVPLPDNFTAPTRMPWGGTKIIGKYKQELQIRPEKHYSIVGESWEISADPIAPSQFLFEISGGETILIDLIQLLDLFPEQILGQRVAAKFEGQNPILVKIIDSADHLSVQVHPDDSYARLRPHESGKPESWYILEAENGAGLYLGLTEGVSKDALRRAIEQEEDVSQYLNFVEVHPGDFFVIDAGTIHAIGARVTLIEPQKIVPKKSGKTYRLWDWNRKYDEHGNLDPNGKPRELHVEDSFNVIAFDGPRGSEFIKHIQPRPQLFRQNGESVEMILTETENFGVSQIVLEGGSELSGNCAQSFHGIVVYEGRMEIYKPGKKITEILRGQSVILPSILQEYTLKGDRAKGIKVYYPEQFLP